MLYLLIGIILFLGIHSVRIFAPAFRENFIATRGDGPWKGLYTVVSLIGLILMIWGYGEARLDNVFLFSPPIWMSHLNMLLMIPALILVVASQTPTGRIKKAVKNPMLIGTKTWAIGHLLANGDLASWLLFGTFLVWAVVLVINTKKRGQTFPEETSAKGDVLAIVIGLAVWAIIAFWAHERFIGVPVIA